jgi:hypothetical protein
LPLLSAPYQVGSSALATEKLSSIGASPAIPSGAGGGAAGGNSSSLIVTAIGA